MTPVIPRVWVPGTPRGYGNSKVAAEWLREMEQELSAYRDAARQHDPEATRYAVTLEFRVWPHSPKYGGKNLPHGSDVDNLAKQTIDGLSHTGRGDLPPGLNAITDDKAVYRLAATKAHVASDAETGVFVTVEVL